MKILQPFLALGEVGVKFAIEAINNHRYYSRYPNHPSCLCCTSGNTSLLLVYASFMNMVRTKQ